MARGNDAEAAADELKAKLGTGGNAADMIAYSDAMYPPELRAANLRRIDEDATADMDEKKAQGYVGDREVLGFAVRGPFLVVVSSDDDGFILKQAFPLDEKQADKLTARQTPAQPEVEEDEDKEVDETVATPEGAAEGASKRHAPAKK